MSKIKNFLVCGGGMMGSAIAQILAGLDDAKVTVYDVFPVDVEAKVRNNMKLLVEKEIVTEDRCRQDRFQDQLYTESRQRRC